MDGKTAYMLYNAWRHTKEAKDLKAPDSYGWLTRYPNNFKRVREAFHVYCITQKILASG